MTQRPDDIHDLLAAYALDALDEDERSVVDVCLDDDAELRMELGHHLQTIGALAEAVDPAPPAPPSVVWDHVAATIEGESAPDVPQFATVTQLDSQRRWNRISTAIAAAAVFVAVAMGLRAFDLQRQTDTIDDLAGAALTDPRSTIADLAGQEGWESANARIVLQEDGVGYLVTDTLPALAADRTYQLWAIVADADAPRVISAGVFGPDPGISTFQAVGDVIGFAITEEREGGVPVSEGETVAVWLRDA